MVPTLMASQWVRKKKKKGVFYWENILTGDISNVEPGSADPPMTISAVNISNARLSTWHSAVHAETGRTYWYNTLTKETTWYKPLDLMSSSAAAVPMHAASAPCAYTQASTNTASVWSSAVHASSGRTYWYNTLTKETTWQAPSEWATPSASQIPNAQILSGWLSAIHAETGRMYWYNTVTKETSWNPPAGVSSQSEQSDSIPSTNNRDHAMAAGSGVALNKSIELKALTRRAAAATIHSTSTVNYIIYSERWICIDRTMKCNPFYHCICCCMRSIQSYQNISTQEIREMDVYAALSSVPSVFPFSQAVIMTNTTGPLDRPRGIVPPPLLDLQGNPRPLLTPLYAISTLQSHLQKHIPYGLPGTDGSRLSNIIAVMLQEHSVLNVFFGHPLSPLTRSLRFLFLYNVWSLLFFLTALVDTLCAQFDSDDRMWFKHYIFAYIKRPIVVDVIMALAVLPITKVVKVLFDGFMFILRICNRSNVGEVNPAKITSKADTHPLSTLQSMVLILMAAACSWLVYITLTDDRLIVVWQSYVISLLMSVAGIEVLLIMLVTTFFFKQRKYDFQMQFASMFAPNKLPNSWTEVGLQARRNCLWDPIVYSGLKKSRLTSQIQTQIVGNEVPFMEEDVPSSYGPVSHPLDPSTVVPATMTKSLFEEYWPLYSNFFHLKNKLNIQNAVNNADQVLHSDVSESSHVQSSNLFSITGTAAAGIAKKYDEQEDVSVPEGEVDGVRYMDVANVDNVI